MKTFILVLLGWSLIIYGCYKLVQYGKTHGQGATLMYLGNNVYIPY